MATNSTEPRKSAATTAKSTTAASKSTGTGRTSAAAQAAAAAKTPVDEIVKAVKDAAHAVVGFGVMGWNKSQVRRRELLKDLNTGRHQMETQLDGAKEQLATAIRHLDAKIEPVRHDFDTQLDKVSQRLPEQVRSVMKSARKIAQDTERQVRQAVGAL